jgi:hypothetical protein
MNLDNYRKSLKIRYTELYTLYSLLSYRTTIKCKGKKKVKISRGGPYGCERSRLPHYLDKRPIYGGKVVSPTSLPPFTLRFLFKIPGTHFY